jgi:hypothetical protein
MAMWRSGRRLFSTAAILMILTAAAHTAGNLIPGDPDPAEQTVFAAMNAFHEPLGMGMNPSMHDIYSMLVFTMSITFSALGIMNLLLAASSQVPDALLRRASWVNAIWVGAFTLLAWKYRIPPPLISGALIETMVLGALFASGKPAKASQYGTAA